MKTDIQTPAQIAAAILHQYAAEIKESCSVGKRQWACRDCAAFLCQKRRHEEVVAAAKALTKLHK